MRRAQRRGRVVWELGEKAPLLMPAAAYRVLELTTATDPIRGALVAWCYVHDTGITRRPGARLPERPDVSVARREPAAVSWSSSSSSEQMAAAAQ